MIGQIERDSFGQRDPIATTPKVAIVIPAYNAAHFLPRSLPPLFQAEDGTRIVVVDAGSTDDTAGVTAALGAQVIRLPQREGPARARNVGAAETESDVILFLDADCVAHPDVIRRVRELFQNEIDLVSVTGSYDSDPPESNFFSDYMNLRHHFFHQRAQRENATFWAGCGAVRRGVFLEAGGFDSERYPRPQIEDIELGVRLRRLGRTCLDPDLQVTHLKRWSLRSVVNTDIRCRAIPWTHLILESGKMPNDLNLGWSQRIAAAIAPLTLVALFAAPAWAWANWWGAFALAIATLGTSVVLHADMLRSFVSLRGVGFALRAWLFQQVHLSYSSASMGLCVLFHVARGRFRDSTRTT